MLGRLQSSDTPPKRLEYRRHDYSGKCANASVNNYLRQYLNDEKGGGEKSYQRIRLAKHEQAHQTHTISIIMLHLIIILKRTTFPNLKHNCLLLRILRGQPTTLERASAYTRRAPFPPTGDPSAITIDNFCHGQVKVDHTRYRAERVRWAARVLRSGSVVTSVREAHGTRVCKPAEEWWEECLYSGLCEHAPGEDDKYACRELQQCKEHPGRYCKGRVERGAGRFGCEEVCVEDWQALGTPEACDYAEDDGYEGDGIFEAGAIVNG